MLFDPIADMLTRIRNANRNYAEFVVIPHSKIKEEIAKILHTEGYINNVKIEKNKESGFKEIKITLKYQGKERIIAGIKKISKPGLRVYSKSQDLPKVLSGLGISIVSTSKGLMTDKQARQQSLGGEVIAYVW